jgi:hypothetical protein
VQKEKFFVFLKWYVAKQANKGPEALVKVSRHLAPMLDDKFVNN